MYVFLPKLAIGSLLHIIHIWRSSKNCHASKQKASFIHVYISDIIFSSGKDLMGMRDEKRLALLFLSYWKITYLSIFDSRYLFDFLQCL